MTNQQNFEVKAKHLVVQDQEMLNLIWKGRWTQKQFHQLTQNPHTLAPSLLWSLYKLVNLTEDLVYKKVHHMDYTMDHLQIPKHQLRMVLIQLLQQPK